MAKSERKLLLSGLSVEGGKLWLAIEPGQVITLGASVVRRTLDDDREEHEAEVSDDSGRTMTLRVLADESGVSSAVCSTDPIPDDWYLPRED